MVRRDRKAFRRTSAGRISAEVFLHGRGKEYDFGTIAQAAGEYLKEPRFEHFRGTDQCIEERCEFLPMCGGGCIHDAIVAHGDDQGFNGRFCQKTLLKELNEGLLKLNHG